MKSIGNERLQSLRKRVRAVLLSGVLTATLVLSNMAGIFTEAVYAEEPEEVKIGPGELKTSDIRDRAVNKNIRVSDGETTLNIDANLTINELIIDNNVTKFTITGDNEHKLTFSKIYNNVGADLIINSGKLVSNSEGIFLGNNIVINGGTVEVVCQGIGIAGKNVTVNEGTVKVTANGDGINGGKKVTINGGTVKAVSSGAGIAGDNSVEITGGNIEATSSDNCAIAAWGNINISGQSTVVKAKTTSDRSYSAIQANSNGKINISSPLKITSPKGGGISGDGSFIATSAGGDQVAKEVEIGPVTSDKKIISGNGSYALIEATGSASEPSYTKGSGVFRLKIDTINGGTNPYKVFDDHKGSLTLNGRALTRDKDYTASSGSLILDIKSYVFDGLQAGEAARFVVDFGTGETMTIPVAVKAAPQYDGGGDDDDDYSSSTPVETVAVTERKAPKTGEV